LDEPELIRRIKNSDAAAFKELSKIYYKPLYGFIWRRTGDPEAVKDILQELFLSVWRLRNSLDEKRPVKPYLFAAANNRIKNFLKSKSLRGKRIIDSLSDELAAGRTPDADFSMFLEDALSGLPENQKMVFIMNKFEGFKYSEIAQMLEISEKTVESRMSKILKELRKRFSKFALFSALCAAWVFIRTLK
jgi:RNA polymerase sigma-70 factor (ECF subfamily)